LTRERWFIALVKPQFEWRDPPASFDGVVRRREDAHRILTDTLKRLAADRAVPMRLIASPIRGRRGNHEYLVMCQDTDTAGRLGAAGEPAAEGFDPERARPSPRELVAALEERW
jgi:hypothetical protein